MPRPAILEGVRIGVKCNVSMAQITDSDALMRMLGEPCGKAATWNRERRVAFFPALGFCKVFIHKVLYDIGDHLARDGQSASACARGIGRGGPIQIFNPLHANFAGSRLFRRGSLFEWRAIYGDRIGMKMRHAAPVSDRLD